MAHVSTDSVATAASPFAPVVDLDTPSAVQPPDVAAITQSQTESPTEAPVAAAAAFAASINTQKKKKAVPTFLKNIKDIHNNQYHRFAREDLFDSKNVKIDLDEFNAWEQKCTEQMRVCLHGLGR